ncbi:hypothetical protein J5N97_013426 [Dioscorea zingiberensis]|uniref:non-specific serine/threonine protein kinase n=1 Tax=Dioscorea zingiberensis TaxID=325984 RepID=A0A9D5CSZ5_9LILI|nr:hypothetical protein J5N97_013426 [Dioscorea zingiberensis]
MLHDLMALADDGMKTSVGTPEGHWEEEANNVSQDHVKVTASPVVISSTDVDPVAVPIPEIGVTQDIGVLQVPQGARTKKDLLKGKMVEIFVPVNDRNFHWYLVVLDVPTRKTYIVDSLPSVDQTLRQDMTMKIVGVIKTMCKHIAAMNTEFRGCNSLMGNYCFKPSNCSADNSSPLSSKNPIPVSNSNTSSSTNPSKLTWGVSVGSSFSSFKSDAAAVNGLKSFTLNDLKNASKNFRPEYLLGEGGFGCVFKGWMDENTLTPARAGAGFVVAIKKLKRESFQGHKEWLAEMTYLGQLHHENLVKLIGYCSEGDNRLLVYEYMPKGSLENHLFRRGTQLIPWSTRVNIAIDVARGLSFLHSLEIQVIYRDLKASNVLLDSEFNAKLSDFGLARDGPTGDKTHVSTKVVGTRGYAAPEYIATGRLNLKSDVYSFGVLILELLSGRRAVDGSRGSSEEMLVDWAKPFLNDRRKMFRIMDTRLEGQYSKIGAQALATLALQCLHVEPRNRPDVIEVLSTLQQHQTK